jgi:Uncharacterized conserved protein
MWHILIYVNVINAEMSPTWYNYVGGGVMLVVNVKNGNVVAESCVVADTFWYRFKGLMGVRELRAGSGMMIAPCNSIHMFFMRISLDIIFLNRDNVVVYMIEGIKPWRISKVVKNANSVIELPVGVIKASNTQLGDKLEIKSLPAT